MSQLAASFKVLRDRDASPTIRGFVYQVDITLERWLQLQPGQALVLECGEDIDVLGRDESPQRLLEQIKHRETQRLTLSGSEARSALANAYEHFRVNQHLDLIFRYTTNCQVGRERVLPRESPGGIILWSQIRKGVLKGRALVDALSRIHTLLKGGDAPEDATGKAFARFLKSATRLQLLCFIHRVEWSTEAPSAVNMRGRLEERIRERKGLGVRDASQHYERLFAHVFSVLCRKGEKRLEPADREALLVALTLPEEVLQTVQALTKRFEALELSLKRREPDFSVMEPSQYIQSPRLNRAVEELQERLRTERVVGLRGRPGDGKSEVARQLAAREGGSYLMLPVREGLAPGEVWNQHFHATASVVLGGEASHEFSLALRQLLGALEGNKRLLIIDNAEVDPPVSIASLVPHQGTVRIVVVGPAEGQLPSVHLPPPSEADFLEITGPTRFEEEAFWLVRRIGQATSFCPLVARVIGTLADSPAPREDLAALLDELGRGDTAEQIRVTLEKCWGSTAMGEQERQRVAFVAAMGEPELPLSWLPLALRQSSRSWGLLERAGVAHREREEAGNELVVRVHRLVAAHAKRSQVDVSSYVLEVLSDWADKSGLLDELKASGARSRAFVSGFQYLLVKEGLAAAEWDSRARLSLAYIDLTPSRALRSEIIAQHLAPLLNGEEAIAALHPAVWGGLVDVLTTYRLHRSTVLDNWLRRAAFLLDQWAQQQPLPSGFDPSWTWMDMTAAYHHAKALGQSGQVEAQKRGAARLEQIDAFCESAPANSPEPWFLRQVRVRFQLASWNWYAKPESRAALLDAVRNRPQTPIPRYLRLAVIARLLRLEEGRSDRLGQIRVADLLTDGLELCKELGNRYPEGQANFLDAAVEELERSGDGERYEDVLAVASAVLMQLLPRVGPDALDAGMAGTRVAYVLGRAGAARDDARGAAAIDSALTLSDRLLVNRDVRKLTQVAMLMRESGHSQRALSLLELLSRWISCGDKDSFFTQLELARTLRWMGKYEAALARIEALPCDSEGFADNGWMRQARDERAWILARQGLRAERETDAARLPGEDELRAQRRHEVTSAEDRNARDRIVAHLYEHAVRLVSSNHPSA